ncbi:cysteine hydrolase [Siculibacillus lacustris]|uniref:Cysteine hydrolase n=1 Tax=Siculibacillus lacustris TaxID=1549641 RepID=A0A4Q9VYI3_9HYPH|nr:cysteine hydrolase family protein [Siculibacillus lacustris]TBW41201.1 cysteine hydrolase [Siculibacillus lacustris]
MTAPNAAPRRALIVVDVQNDYDGGGLPIVHPPFAESIAAIGRAMDAATAAGIPVVVIRQNAPETAPIFARGSHGGTLHPVVANRPRDHLIDKALPSAFTGTDLESWLRARAIETITVVGYMTHNCDLSTVIHALHMGFAVEVLSDATGSLAYANRAGRATAEEIHRVCLVVMQARFAAVLPTDEWIAGLASGELPPRDTIFGSARAGAAL